MSSLPEWIDLPHRKPTRSPHHDFDSAATYHVVVCVKDMAQLLGKVMEGRMMLNGIGRMVAESIKHHFTRYAGVELKACGIMPNHLHLLVIFHEPGLSGRAVGLTKVIQHFKSYTATTHSKWRKQNALLGLPEKLWQDSFWDRVIRTRRRCCSPGNIENNPLAWQLAKNHPRG
jgi:REP element-mobilizing transposase RayT